MKRAVTVALVGGLLLLAGSFVIEAPKQRSFKLDVCQASGRTFEDCRASVPRTVWDNIYDAIFR